METQITNDGREVAHFGVPWEKTYGYAQAVRVGKTIYVAGQLSHDDEGNFIGPAHVDESGRPRRGYFDSFVLSVTSATGVSARVSGRKPFRLGVVPTVATSSPAGARALSLLQLAESKNDRVGVRKES